MDKKKKEVNYTKVQKLKASVLRTIVWLSAGITTAILLALIGYILIKGIPCLKPSLFAWEYNTDNVSMMPAIINTIVMTLVTLLLPCRLAYSLLFIWWNMPKEEINW